LVRHFCLFAYQDKKDYRAKDWTLLNTNSLHLGCAEQEIYLIATERKAYGPKGKIERGLDWLAEQKNPEYVDIAAQSYTILNDYAEKTSFVKRKGRKQDKRSLVDKALAASDYAKKSRIDQGIDEGLEEEEKDQEEEESKDVDIEYDFISQYVGMVDQPYTQRGRGGRA